MSTERRTATEDVELREEGESLTAVGYASVFNKTYGIPGFVERVAPGAFSKTVAEANVVGLFNHEPDNLLGRSSSGTLRMAEDDKGLRYEIDLPPTQLGRDTAALLRRGDLVGSSMGFRVLQDQWSETDDGYPLRTIQEVALRDVGPVTFPASSATEASLRSLAELRNLDIAEVVDAANSDTLSDLLHDEPEEASEPDSPHSPGLPPSSFIR
jgi:HK97 family phage prohead protease